MLLHALHKIQGEIAPLAGAGEPTGHGVAVFALGEQMALHVAACGGHRLSQTDGMLKGHQGIGDGVPHKDGRGFLADVLLQGEGVQALLVGVLAENMAEGVLMTYLGISF